MADDWYICDPRVAGGQGYERPPYPSQNQPYPPQYPVYPAQGPPAYPVQHPSTYQKQDVPPQYPGGPPRYDVPLQPAAEGYQNVPVTFYPPAQDVRREGPVYQQSAPRESTGITDYLPSLDDDPTFSPSFQDKAIRQQFIAKVFAIVGIKLLFTTSVIAVCLLVPGVKRFILNNAMPALIVAMVTYLGSVIAITCCHDLRRKFPWNFLLLGFLTAGVTALTAVVTATYSVTSVLIAAGVTCVVVFIIALVSVLNLIDITKFIGVLSILGVILLVFALIATITSFFVSSSVIRIIDIVYSGFATIVISLFLMFDIQSILGGRRIEISPEEYVLAATQIYVDVVTLFLHLLFLIGAARGER